MIKALVLLALAALAVRWLTGRWPWAFFSQPAGTGEAELAQARRILGVTRNAPPAEIREAHRRKAAIAHPDRGGSTPAIQELNAARDLLLAHHSPHDSEPEQ